MEALSTGQGAQFVDEGFVLVQDVFDRAVAEAGSAVVWDAIGRHARGWSSPEYPVTWDRGLVHLQYGWTDGPFADVVTPRFESVIDELVGAGRWAWDRGMGWWPILFPGFASDASVVDLGWHHDSDEVVPSVRQPEKALLVIPLFSDVDAGDGGTAVFRGSHRLSARLLADAERRSVAYAEVRPYIPRPTDDGDVFEVTGRAGDVLFAHPFLVHASNRNVGSRVRFACNPHVGLLAPLDIDRPGGDYSLVEVAIRSALAA